MLVHSRGAEPLASIAEAVEWALRQQIFSRQQLEARFPWLSGAETERLLEMLTRYGLFAAHDPAL